ncbi:ejaculatory bulb-specific protein 3 [Halyomorpha halys]|uniref:ejaculatory bulb-specific protein 3 n=1 Tax=Halyomorpha halys TaxID=286706 RepID=UPI0006D4C97F|nr:ejaculatory bulb-specific protein 3 [Halyomorpha halys]
MKLVILLLVMLAAVASADKYTTQYDNIDIDEILSNDRLYKKYYDCLMGKGKCTPDGQELKKNMPDAITTDCSKCSEKQKVGSQKVLKFMLDKKESDYTNLEKVFDPTGTYRKKHAQS